MICSNASKSHLCLHHPDCQMQRNKREGLYLVSRSAADGSERIYTDSESRDYWVNRIVSLSLMCSVKLHIAAQNRSRETLLSTMWKFVFGDIKIYIKRHLCIVSAHEHVFTLYTDAPPRFIYYLDCTLEKGFLVNISIIHL